MLIYAYGIKNEICNSQKIYKTICTSKAFDEMVCIISIIASRIAQENYSNYTVINFNDYDSNYFII